MVKPIGDLGPASIWFSVAVFGRKLGKSDYAGQGVDQLAQVIHATKS